MDPASDWYSASVPVNIHVISHNIRPRYNGTWLNTDYPTSESSTKAPQENVGVIWQHNCSRRFTNDWKRPYWYWIPELMNDDLLFIITPWRTYQNTYSFKYTKHCIHNWNFLFWKWLTSYPGHKELNYWISLKISHPVKKFESIIPMA